MNRPTVAAAMVALAGWLGIVTCNGYRTGAVPIAWLGGLVPFRIARRDAPRAFRIAVALNIAVTAAFAIAGVVLLASR